MGVIMGTAAYLSPERAASKPTDTRSDIWSLGVVLFEMLSGQGLFTGETVSHILGAVLQVEPRWDALPASTPQALRKLLSRCLVKDRKNRLQHIGDVRVEISDLLADPLPVAALAVEGPTAKERLTLHAAEDDEPTWSPSGDRIAFTSDRLDESWDIPCASQRRICRASRYSEVYRARDTKLD